MEVQAGVTPTQLQLIEFKGRSDVSWTEYIAPIKLDPEISHTEDWYEANQTAGEALNYQIPLNELNEIHDIHILQ